MKLKSPYLIKPRTRVRLSHLRTDDDGGYKTKEAAVVVLNKHRNRLDALQNVLYASAMLCSS